MPRDLSAVVVGAGFGGVAAAVELRRRGVRDVRVLERASTTGGVWRDNTYPGAACDVPSALYSFSWAPNADWPRRYPEQPDILAYLRGIVRRERLEPLIRTRTEVVAARWDDARARWEVTTRHGGTETVEHADVLVWAAGQLSRPAVPALPGADSFAGRAFHSARWDHALDLDGRRVAVVGTGASAIQLVPHLQRVAAQVTVFQRSAPYVVPKPDRGYTALHRAAFRALPSTQAFGRELTRLLSELFNEGLGEQTRLTRVVEGAFRLHLARQVRDPALRARLVPDYPVGCKRLLFSNDWYPALTQPNVEVVTDGVAGLTPCGVVTTAGVERAADVVVYATGFRATEFLGPVRVLGRQGRALATEWADGAHAHLGITVPGFPNMFLVYGPNTNLGGSSILSMIECQVGYLGQAVGLLRSGAADVVEVRRDLAARYDREIQDRLARSVWAGGCTSWYQTASGRITTNWPGTVREYRRRTARFHPEDHRPPTSDAGAPSRDEVSRPGAG